MTSAAADDLSLEQRLEKQLRKLHDDVRREMDEETARAAVKRATMSFLAGLDDVERDDVLQRRWLWTRRPSQIAPTGDWRFWVVSAGRGWGKTRVGAEWVLDHVESGAVKTIALVAKTAADARDVMVRGISGIIACAKARGRDVPLYTPSTRTLTWKNGAVARTFSAEQPDQLRGPQHQLVWGDEPAAWQYPQDTLDQIQFGLRIPWTTGGRARALLTTTPRRIPSFLALLKRPGVVVTRGKTLDNVGNLDADAVADLLAAYQNTRLGKQELEAELLEDVEGALWSRDQIDRLRVERTPDIARVVVAVDPAASSGEGSAETGILVVGIGDNGHCYVLADRSGRMKPSEWGQRVIETADEFLADCIVAEANNGGEMVESTIGVMRAPCPVKLVYASRGKKTRAGPVDALYQQGKVHHLGMFGELEDQMCSFTGAPGETSPDRLDALVWGVTYLAVQAKLPLALASA